MTSSVLKDGFPRAHLTTRQWVESSIDPSKLFAAIDADSAVVGARVVYLDAQMRAIVSRESQVAFEAVNTGLACTSAVINHPEMPRKMIKLKQIAAEMPKRYTSAEVRNGTIFQMLDALDSASAVAGNLRSGNIRPIAVGLYEGGPE
ncbi:MULTISPECIES: hypothetical protein [unclassified Pseudomonas]|uniref:hypothetical protein n=1 Tax=unclassified Pseudomonas TaxID=196821 RepID=UPI000CDA9B9E|nr:MULTISPECIES: hypothetical protein [unclassified Pseudomonas]MCK3851856.1 hypothetical protein [Pseudomonas sp. W2Jun17]